MNLHFSYKVAKSADLENDIQQHVQKLEKRLQVFRPELVHLHGTVDQAPRDAFAVSLNLRLPSGQLSAQNNGNSAATAVRVAFGDLVNQLRRHKELLRSEHKWQRQKQHSRQQAGNADVVQNLQTDQEMPQPRPDESETPRSMNGKSTHAEITEAAFADDNRPTVQKDVRMYVNANLPRLERFVARELRFLDSSEQGISPQMSVDEVIDEVVVTALSAEERPTQLPLERWLYRLAIQAIKRIAAGEADFDTIPLEQHVGTQNVTGSDENFLQFHQPGETFNREDTIADVRASNPEDQAASDELIDQLEEALHGVNRDDREAFVLYAIEGFTVDEIASVTDRVAGQVRNSIETSRAHLGRKLPASHALKKKLLQHSTVA
ncbi:MAG TPA: HPF/RaiA family ribosome-associated protein [Terriglobales bacterium]|nr:HPF/RaiA family ribosome-associated protein [Terriglobales bacterium]